MLRPSPSLQSLACLESGKGSRSSCRLLLGSTMGWLCGTTTSTSAADEDLDEEEMDLVRTEGPDLSPLECSSAAEVQSPFRGRARGENNERGGAEGGFCAVLGHTHSEICRIFEKPRISDLDLTPKRPYGWFGPLPGAFLF